MSPLETRKQLLIAESEVNRAELLNDLDCMRIGSRSFFRGFKILGSISSIAALLGSVIRRREPSRDAKKSSWFKRIFKGAQVAGSIWLALRRKR